MAGFRTVRIQRFKNITDAPFELQDVNVLVGANNSGKSSILQALHFGIGAIQSLHLEGLLRGHGAKIATVNPSRLIYVPSEDVHALGSGGRLWEPQESAVQIEFGLDTGDTLTVRCEKGETGTSKSRYLTWLRPIDLQISKTHTPYLRPVLQE
jgi:hypothetical protein